MSARESRTPRVLSIAGSDSGGGAGVQADLKAFARCGVHGMTAITALTAQNTVGVSAIHAVPGEMVLAQVRAVASDIGVDAVKVGMLGTVETVAAVALALDELPPGTPVVVDPVMVSESGALLLEAAAQSALVEQILPRATVLTPNIPEALALLGRPGAGAQGETAPGAAALAAALLELGPAAVVVTGGHRQELAEGDDVWDVFLDRQMTAPTLIRGPRHAGGAAHGSGCTHSSVLAAQLSLGHTPLEAARTARVLAGAAVGEGLRELGAGAGPVDILGLARFRAALPEVALTLEGDLAHLP